MDVFVFGESDGIIVGMGFDLGLRDRVFRMFGFWRCLAIFILFYEEKNS